MKKLFLITVAIASLSTAASAADLAARPYTKAPAYVAAAVYDWSGFYIGANGGYAWSRDARERTDLATGILNLGSYDPAGGTVGGQIGYRWQSASWVFGLEAQGNWADINGSTQNLGNPLNQIASRMDAFGLFTAQLGYAWNNTLFYVKGGAAVTDRNYEFVSNATGAAVSTTGYQTRWGGTIGAGFEYGFAPNWSFGVEYNHIFESRYTAPFVAVATGLPLPGTYVTGGDTDMVLARINYKFGGPILAKY